MITFIKTFSWLSILLGLAGIYLAFNLNDAFVPGSISLAALLAGILCLECSNKS